MDVTVTAPGEPAAAPAVMVEPTAPVAAPAPPPAAAPEPASPAPVAETAAAAAPAEAPAPAAALLAADPAAKPDAAAGDPAAVAGDPPVPVAYEPFTAPEGFTLAPEAVAQFTGLIGQHGVSQENAQALFDMHTAALAQHHDQLMQQQRDVFAETRRGWVQQFENDPELGGNRQATTLEGAKWAIDELTAGHAKQFYEALAATGMGDHPEMVRLLHNAAKRLRERSAPGASQPTRPNRPPEERRYKGM